MMSIKYAYCIIVFPLILVITTSGIVGILLLSRIFADPPHVGTSNLQLMYKDHQQTDFSFKRMEQQLELLIKQNSFLIDRIVRLEQSAARLEQSAARSEQKIEEMKQSNGQQFKVIQTMRTEMAEALQSDRTTQETLATQKEEKIVAKVDARNTTEECTLFCCGLKSTGNGIKIAFHYFGYPYHFVFGKTTSTVFSLCTWLLIIGLLIVKFYHFESEEGRDATKRCFIVILVVLLIFYGLNYLLESIIACATGKPMLFS